MNKMIDRNNLHILETQRGVHHLDSNIPTWISTHFSTKYKFQSGQFILHQGEPSERILFVLNGWGQNHVIAEDGKKQIINFILPGDLIGHQTTLLHNASFSVEAITEMTLLGVNKSRFEEIISENADIYLQLRQKMENYQRILEKRIALLTTANSVQSMAQMFLLLYTRLIEAGVEEEEARILPLNQLVLSEALGISHIHTHRIFNMISKSDLVKRVDSSIILLDPKGLSEISNDGYLEEY